MRRRPLAAVPAWAWLAGIVVLSVLVRYAVGRRLVAPWIMVDELIYSELAKSFADEGAFRIRGELSAGYGFVYPLVISPAWALFDSVPTAYAAAKAINAVAMSLAAVPAYFLARRVLRPGLALAAAALTVAVPSLLYTGTLMTENVFYPLFLTFALALARVLERPSPGRVALLLALGLLAFLTRAQAVALAPALLVAPVLYRGRRALGDFATLYVAVAAGALALAALQLARGRGLFELLGAYETVGERSYGTGEVAKWLLWHLGELDLYAGVVPFAALLLLALRWRPEDRLFLAVALPLVVSVVLVVAAFASLPSVQRIEERNMFYVAPLFFIALLLWIERGLPRPPAAGACAVLAAGLTAAVPYPRLIGVSAQSDTLMLLPWWWLQDHVLDLGWVRWEVLAFALAAAAAFRFLPSRYALALPALLAAYYLVTALPIQNGRHGLRNASIGALFQGITTGDRDWVDEAAGRDARVVVVWSGRVDHRVVWQNEFFSRSVGAIYHLDQPVPGGMAQQAVRTGDDGRLRGAGRADYVLADDAALPAGILVARDERKGVGLYRTDGVPALAARVEGVYADQWSQAVFTYTRFRCRGGRVLVTVESDASLFRAPQRLAALAGGGSRVVTIRPGTSGRLTGQLTPDARGRCRAVFAVQPTAVPAEVQAGSGDERRLGILVRSVEYRP